MKWLRRYLGDKEPTLKNFRESRAGARGSARVIVPKLGASQRLGRLRGSAVTNGVTSPPIP